CSARVHLFGRAGQVSLRFHSCVTTSLVVALVWCLLPTIKMLNSQTVKKCSVKRWTLLALNGRHLGYVAEEEEPFQQLFSLESWLTDASQITSTIIAGYNNCVIG